MLPRLRVLAYQPTRPHLRLIRLPELEIEPSPVPLNNAGSALDHCLRRDGWIAFSATGVWGVPVPLSGKAFRVSKYSFDLLPSRNDRAIWISDGTGNQPGTYFEYDGQAREIVERVQFPGDARLIADRGEWLLVYSFEQGWLRWERGGVRGEALNADRFARPGAVFPALREPGKLEVADAGGERFTVESPVAGGWGKVLQPFSFSPDRRFLAIDVNVWSPAATRSTAEIGRERGKYRPVPHQLVLIDCVARKARLVDGVFDNFASEPVWSHDSEWLVFQAPFMPRGLWACRVADARLDWVSFGRRSPPVPLANVSDLVED